MHVWHRNSKDMLLVLKTSSQCNSFVPMRYCYPRQSTMTMTDLCFLQTVAIGYSKFCELFTEEEWKGFNYA